MSVNTTTTWGDTCTCPFCGDDLADPGAGFVDHIHERPDCESGFEIWRTNLSSDLVGEWSG